MADIVKDGSSSCRAALPGAGPGGVISNQPRVLVDPATGKEVVLKAKHELFFVPIKFWPYVLIALGVWMFFKG